MMGHTDIKMIMEVYAQLDEEREKAGAKIYKISIQKCNLKRYVLTTF